MLLTLAALVVLLAGLRAAGPLIVPLLLSAFLTILSAPLVLWLQKRKVPEILAVTFVVLAVVGVLAAVAGVVGGSVNRFVAAIPRYQEGLDDLVSGLSDYLDSFGIGLSFDKIRKVVDPGAAIGMAGTVVSQLASLLSNAFLVVLTMVFMLFEVAYLPSKLREAMGDEHADLGRFKRVVREVNGYVAIKTYVSIATGLLIGVTMALLGVDFPVLWGVTAFLLNYIPNIGSIIAAIPPVLLSLVQYGVGRSLAVAAVFVVVNTVIGNMLEPRLMGRRLGLSTLVVFVSLVFWGWMWGPLGMLLSVPLTMIVKILLEHSGQFRWIAVLMDAGPSAEPLPSDE